MVSQDFLELLIRKLSVRHSKKFGQATLLLFGKVRVTIYIRLDDVRRLLIGIKDRGLLAVGSWHYPSDRDIEPIDDLRKVGRRRGANLPLDPRQRRKRNARLVLHLTERQAAVLARTP